MLGVLRVGFLENTSFLKALGMCDFQRPGLASRALKRSILRGLEHPLKSVKVKRVSARVMVLAGRAENTHMFDAFHVFWSICEQK